MQKQIFGLVKRIVKKIKDNILELINETLVLIYLFKRNRKKLSSNFVPNS